MELSQDKVDLQLRTLKVINGDIKFMKIFLLVSRPHLNLLQIYKENNEPTQIWYKVYYSASTNK